MTLDNRPPQKHSYTSVFTAVVFDLGNVLVECNPRNLYRKIFSSEYEMELFLSSVCIQEWNEKQDAGRPFAEGVVELVTKFPEFVTEIQAFDSRWEEMLGQPIWAVVKTLEQVKQNGFKLFDEIVISGRIKLKKPDPRIFNYLCKRVSIEPCKMIFIDDFPVNVEAAANIGFQAIRYTTASALEDDLRRLQVLL